jgi:ABC-type uncharacterized transport system substrate-binding protein
MESIFIYDKLKYIRKSNENGNRPVITNRGFVASVKTGTVIASSFMQQEVSA